MPTAIPTTYCMTSESFNKSVIYSITHTDIVERTSDYIIYRVPYSENTFWTTFRLTRFGQNGVQLKTPSVDIVLVTADGAEYTVQSYRDSISKWNTISNPIPSMKYDHVENHGMGVYFRVYLSEKESIHAMPFHLIGYINLFPSAPYYQYTYDRNIQYVFLRSNDEHGIILSILLDYCADQFVYDRENCTGQSDAICLGT